MNAKMRMRMLRILPITLAILLILPGLSIAGGIQGKAIFTGKTAPLPPHKTGKYKKACGPLIPNEELLIDNKGLANVVVYIEGEVPGGITINHVIDQKDCQYHPHVTAMMKEEEILFPLKSLFTNACTMFFFSSQVYSLLSDFFILELLLLMALRTDQNNGKEPCG